ncbi:hypothetical protein FRC07_008947 [Ceratobasidium sp. 392]|nr:hypothetical protein FRC07_008947 [Ceratobasidium sp. 392]
MSDVVMGKPEDEVSAGATAQTTTNPGSSPAGKGKGKEKSVANPVDESMEEDDDDEEEEEEDEELEEEDEDDEDLSEIDPNAIIPPSETGRPRRNRPTVDYSSKEAMAKAGVDPTKVNDDD